MNSIKICVILTLLLFLPYQAHSQITSKGSSGQLIHVNDMDMNYKVLGTGKPLLLLHAFGGCGSNWDAFTEELAEHYRLIIPDLRGHGHSTNPSGSFTHRETAYDVLALLDSLEIGEYSAMGISTGGMTLLHMATQQPARAKKIVLIGATTHFPEQAREIMHMFSPDLVSEDILNHFRPCAGRGDEQVRQLTDQFYGFRDSYNDMNFTPPHLATISASTLIIHGDRDDFFPVDIPVEMYHSIPDAALWIVPDGGHVPIFGSDMPFMKVALRFLEGVNNH